jgi:hypothetical protein
VAHEPREEGDSLRSGPKAGSAAGSASPRPPALNSSSANGRTRTPASRATPATIIEPRTRWEVLGGKIRAAAAVMAAARTAPGKKDPRTANPSAAPTIHRTAPAGRWASNASDSFVASQGRPARNTRRPIRPSDTAHSTTEEIAYAPAATTAGTGWTVSDRMAR